MGFRPIRRAAFVSLLLFSLSGHAAAQQVDAATRSAARDLGYAGVAAYQAGDYTTASAKLEKAYAVLKAPSLGLWSARALARLGKLVEAAERYVDVSRLDTSSGETAVHEQAKKDAKAEHDMLVPKIPKLIVRVDGVDPTEVSITIDGVPMQNALIGEKRPVNPGPHVVKGKRGDEVVEGKVALTQGGEDTVQLTFEGGPLPVPPAAAAPEGSQPNAPGSPPPADRGTRSSGGSSTLRTFGWISLVAGASGLVAGGITGIVALDWKSQIEGDKELDNPSNRSRQETFRNISVGCLIGGGVLATTGVVLLIVAPAPNTAQATSGPFVALDVGPGSLGLRGKF